MRFSTHYYVLSLSPTRCALFEAFRDLLIEVENQGFPLSGSSRGPEARAEEQRQELARRVDECFGHYHRHEPLGLMVVGTPEMMDAFLEVTAYSAAVIGRIEGDHRATSPRDLGQIVWPVVKEAMTGVVDRAMRDLRDCTGRGHVASGLDAVVRAAGQETRATLLVEEDYHHRGSIRGGGISPVPTPDVDVREVIDDVVDAVIEQVLEAAGHVVFTPSGALRGQERIVLLRHSEATHGEVECSCS